MAQFTCPGGRSIETRGVSLEDGGLDSSVPLTELDVAITKLIEQAERISRCTAEQIMKHASDWGAVYDSWIFCEICLHRINGKGTISE